MNNHEVPVSYPQKNRNLLSTIIKGYISLLNLIMSLTEIIGSIMLSIMTLIITWQVISRYNPNINSPWTEEIALMLLVWFGMAGAAIGIRKGSHIGVEFIFSILPAKVQRLLNILGGLLILTFSIFLLTEGWALAKGCWTVQLPATLLPRGIFVYLAVPVAACLMILYSSEFIINQFRRVGGDQNEL